MELMDIYSFRYKQIGRKIAYFRSLRNLTQAELAEKINISISSLGKIERGVYNNNVSLTILMSIANGLNIDLVMLLSFDEKEAALETEKC